MQSKRREFLKLLGMAAMVGPSLAELPAAVEAAEVDPLNLSVYDEVVFPKGQRLHGEQEVLYSGPFLDETKFLITNVRVSFRGGRLAEHLALLERGNIQASHSSCSTLPLFACRFVDCPNDFSLPMLAPVMVSAGDSIRVKLIPGCEGWPKLKRETRVVVTLDGMMTRRVR